jgi:hypothetical protein
LRIGFFLSSQGGSPLVVGLERGLQQLGHSVEAYRDQQMYDLLLVVNQSAHRTDYQYPPFPTEKNVRFAFIDTAEYGPGTRCTHSLRRQYANAFTGSAKLHDTKNPGQQERLHHFLEGRSFPYFLREMFADMQYPKSYHPIDYPLYAHSVCHARPSREQYMRRAEDLFCWWGGSHPWRVNLTQELRAHPCQKTVRLIEEDGTPRLPQREYFARIENAKCSVSFDGYGSGAFRICEVLARTVLLQGPLSIVLREPLRDGVTCVEYQVDSDGETFLKTNIGEKLQWVIDNPEAAFQIYDQGYEHVNSKWTERATAEYVLQICESHRWDVTTPLEVI